jgi:hypothetical protein
LNPVLVLYMIGVAAIGIALAAYPPRHPSTAPASRDAAAMASLGGVMLALLIVGVVSGTVPRHIVQIAPMAAALALVAGGSSYGAAAAAPLFTFWLGLMVNIWLFLLGFVRMISGTFTPIEIALTVAIGVLSAVGLLAVGRRPTSLSRGARVVAASGFAILQVAALILSFTVEGH